jgi:hypothetical protein
MKEVRARQAQLQNTGNRFFFSILLFKKKWYFRDHKYLNMQKLILLLTAFSLLQFSTQAQEVPVVKKEKRIKITSGVESNLIQFAKMDVFGYRQTTIPRYTYFFNMGVDANLKLSKHLKLYSGLSLKNIGLIVKQNDSVRWKYRVYTIGAPIGFKLFMAKEKVIFKAGADASLAFNYKWKKIANKTKSKGNEFFSDQTPLLFTSLYAGVTVHGFAVTANYYLNNFFNKDVYNIDARLFTIGIGFNVDDHTLKAMKEKRNKKSAL